MYVGMSVFGYSMARVCMYVCMYLYIYIYRYIYIHNI